MNAPVTAACFASVLLLWGCDDDDGPRPPELPAFFRLDAVATAASGEFDVDCSLDFIVEVHGEMSRTGEVVEYIATMGGEAFRSILRDDGSGVAFRADAFYPNLQILHILPDRVQLVSLDFPPDGQSTGSRFWDELRFFDGTIDRDGVIKGEWLCAPFDTAQGGIDDDTAFAAGTWVTETLDAGRGQSLALPATGASGATVTRMRP